MQVHTWILRVLCSLVRLLAPYVTLDNLCGVAISSPRVFPQGADLTPLQNVGTGVADIRGEVTLCGVSVRKQISFVFSSRVELGGWECNCSAPCATRSTGTQKTRCLKRDFLQVLLVPSSGLQDMSRSESEQRMFAQVIIPFCEATANIQDAVHTHSRVSTLIPVLISGRKDVYLGLVLIQTAFPCTCLVQNASPKKAYNNTFQEVEPSVITNKLMGPA